MINKQSLVVLSILCPFYFLLGQSIFSNVITGANPHNDNPYITGQVVDANISVLGIGRGSGLTIPGVSTNDRYNARSWSTTTLDANDYFYFTLTPNSGYGINFTSLVFNSQRSNDGPVNIAVRSSLDGYTTDIGSPTIGAPLTPTLSTIDLSSSMYQGITSSVTFRVYAWSAGAGTGTFSINDFIFNGSVYDIQCPNTSTWNGTSWSSTPNSTSAVIINGNYNTTSHGNFTACRLTVNTGFVLTVNNSTYVEIENDVIVNGDVVVESQGAIIQNNDLATVTENGSITVEKLTPPLNAWYEYVYWSSPVFGETIGGGLSDSDYRRRFKFEAQNYLDATMESNNNDATIAGQDDVDDNGDDWQSVSTSATMIQGVGYASTHDEVIFNSTPGGLPKSMKYTFEGPINNGVISVPIYRNDTELNDNNWNLIGNPYPSAIDVDLFFDQNKYDAILNPSGTLEGVIYLWSHNTPPSSLYNGNQRVNFSASDYAIINGSGGVAGGDGVTPDSVIPSCQGFFVAYDNDGAVTSVVGSIKEGEVIFNNAMRKVDTSSNAKFFKNSEGKGAAVEESNKLWVNLTSDNGVFNQTLISYREGASNDDDGPYFDAVKNPIIGISASIYTIIENSNKKFAIQGKSIYNLNLDEHIAMGFKTSISVPTLYTISIPKVQGSFFYKNRIYIKDRLLNKIHDLSTTGYSFTSEMGEFNERFEILFKTVSLSLNETFMDNSSVRIIDLGNDNVKFIVSNNLKITKVIIFDMFGRKLYKFEGNNSSEVYNLSKLHNVTYIYKVFLSNGDTIIRKGIKR